MCDPSPDRRLRHRGYGVLVEASRADGFVAWTYDATVTGPDGSIRRALVNERMAAFDTALAALDGGESEARDCVDALLRL